MRNRRLIAARKSRDSSHPLRDYIEELIDLQRILDLRKPGIFLVRVKGEEMRDRGIRNGDILIANTAARPAHGKVAITI